MESVKIMSKFNKVSKLALAVSTTVALSACDSGGGVSGGGGAQVASDFCQAVNIASSATSYSNSLASLVEDGASGAYQYSVVQQPTNGSVLVDAATGTYTFTPTSAGSRGYSTSFTYGVIEDGEQIDSGEVEIIYGAKRIMPLGDSVTYGVIYNSGTTTADDRPLSADAVGYRKALYDKLADAGYSVDFVGSRVAGGSAGLADSNHQGAPGMRADTMAANVSGYLSTSKPDIVLAHAGTNDLFQSESSTDTATAVTTLVTNMQTWQSTADQALTVIEAQIIPSHQSAAGNSSVALATIEAFNTQMANSLSATFDNSINANFQVRLVDQYNELDPATDMTTIGTIEGQDRNGLHPNSSGYAKMADKWYEALIDSNELAKCD